MSRFPSKIGGFSSSPTYLAQATKVPYNGRKLQPNPGGFTPDTQRAPSTYPAPKDYKGPNYDGDNRIKLNVPSDFSTRPSNSKPQKNVVDKNIIYKQWGPSSSPNEPPFDPSQYDDTVEQKVPTEKFVTPSGKSKEDLQNEINQKLNPTPVTPQQKFLDRIQERNNKFKFSV
jgi:hypothetical protein